MLVLRLLLFTMLLLPLPLRIAGDAALVPRLRPMVEFSDSAIQNYSSLVIDPYDDVVYLAARNYLLAINITTMVAIEVVESKPTEQAKEFCYRNWKPDEECENYIHLNAAFLAETSEDQLIVRPRFLVCNSEAHQPHCDIRSSLAQESTLFVDEGSFPAKPKDVLNNFISLVSEQPGRDNVVSYSSGFIAVDMPAITKSFGAHKISSSSSSSWLNKPTFISMHDSESSVLVFFREAAPEAFSRRDAVYSRVARVCKSDSGRSSDPLYVDEAVWTSYAKAQLLCSSRIVVGGNTHSIEYNFLQDVYFDEVSQVFTAVFLNKDPLIWSNGGHKLDSAVCTFTLADISAAFNHHSHSATCESTTFRNAGTEVEKNPDELSSYEEILAEDEVLTVNEEEESGNEVQEPVYDELPSESDDSLLSASLFRRSRSVGVRSVPVDVLVNRPVTARHSMTLPATFIQQVVTKTVVTDANLNYSVTFLLDSAAQLYTAYDDLTFHSEGLYRILDGSRQRFRFREMKIFTRDTVDYLVIINDDRLIRVTISSCERLLSEPDCTKAQNSHCLWIASASICVPRLLDSDSNVISYSDTDTDADIDFDSSYSTTAVPDADTSPIVRNHQPPQQTELVVNVSHAVRNSSRRHWHNLLAACQHKQAYLSVSHTVTCCVSQFAQSYCSCQLDWNLSFHHRLNLSVAARPTSTAISAPTSTTSQSQQIRHFCAIRMDQRLESAPQTAEVLVALSSPIPWVSFCVGLLLATLAVPLVKKRAMMTPAPCQPCRDRPRRRAVRRPAKARAIEGELPAKRPCLSLQAKVSRYADPDTYQNSLRRVRLESVGSKPQVASQSHLSTRCSTALMTANVNVIIHMPAANTEAL